MLQMDSQFTSLLNSYNSNYVQYKVTGNASYKNSYTKAQEGIESILSQMEKDVNSEKASISDFYKSGVEQKMNELQQKNRRLQRGIVSERDDITAANMRGEQPLPLPAPPAISTNQYITLGVLGAVMLGLAVL